jgi:hypothetical protein
MRAVSRGFVLLVIAVVSGTLQINAWSAEERPIAAPRWEYRVLTKEQVLDLGKKDLAVGLNQLGGEGWELAAVDAAYIFKRSKDRNYKQAEEIKSQVALLESEVEMLRDRVTWADRMVRKGYMTDQQLRAEREALKQVELALNRARKDLATLLADPKRPAEKERKPAK